MILFQDEHDRKSRRRGFWKKVKVRPVTTESIEFAESQYYTNTVNRLGQPVNQKAVHEKTEKGEKPKVTTYKPKIQYIKDVFSSDDDGADIDVIPTMDIHKINNTKENDNEETLINEESKRTTVYLERDTQTVSPGDLDLGTGSPDPTIDDSYDTTPTEPATKVADDNKSGGFSFLDFIFGTTSQDNEKVVENNATKANQTEIQSTPEQSKAKIITTESAFIPEEVTTSPSTSDDTTRLPEFTDIQKINPTDEARTEQPTESHTVISVSKVESSSVSSFMDPANILSTSMSTEISHETEICFRGKCIKTSKDIL